MLSLQPLAAGYANCSDCVSETNMPCFGQENSLDARGPNVSWKVNVDDALGACTYQPMLVSISKVFTSRRCCFTGVGMVLALSVSRVSTSLA